MDEFITLSCPTCGGKLTIDKDATVYVCEYCGRQHIIRPEDKEFYAKCPLCQRNDKVDKVTALYSVSGLSNEKLTPPKHPDETMFFIPEPRPEFTKKPKVREKPIKDFKEAKVPQAILVFIFCSILFALSFLINLLMARIFTGISVFFFLLVLLVNIKARRNLYVQWESENQKYEADLQKVAIWEAEQNKIRIAQQEWKVDNQESEKEFQVIKTRNIEKYNKAMERYNKLYYCRRDDCIFIPGETGYASASDLNEFVYKGISNP